MDTKPGSFILLQGLEEVTTRLSRDLNNGFLIAEILARYKPNQLSMHSFDNSQNTVRKASNWSLLEKYFTKYEQEFPFKPAEYMEIKEGNFEDLVKFMVKLYGVLTKRRYLAFTQCHPQPLRHLKGYTNASS